MTFFLVMLHTGTMLAVIVYFWPRWKVLFFEGKAVSFIKMIFLATLFTGVVGLGLKKFIEKVIFRHVPHAEVEMLFRNLPLIAVALFLVGLVIIAAGRKKAPSLLLDMDEEITSKSAVLIGMVQGLCLPFRGFSRSGATISTALFCGISRDLAEQFSFALAVVLTPVAIFLELHRLLKSNMFVLNGPSGLVGLLSHGIIGMILSALTGLVALSWLSSWLERGRWKFFGYYCLVASMVVGLLSYIHHWN